MRLRVPASWASPVAWAEDDWRMHMASTIVRYILKPERLDEHLALIDAVFAELADINEPGIHYSVYRSEEGHEFTHVATFETEAARAAFGASEAFASFTADIGDRCTSPPDAVTQIKVHAAG